MPIKTKIEQIIRKVIEEDNSAFFFTPPIHREAVSYIFSKPFKKLQAFNIKSFREILTKLDRYKNEEKVAYGFINYEAGYLFEERLQKFFNINRQKPIARFFIFEPKNVQKFKSDEINFSGVGKILESQDYSINNFELNTSEADYKKNVEKIRKYIAEGDTYQANYTVKGKFDFEGSIESLFLNLIFNQSAKYTALINSEDNIYLSISPELFFEMKGQKISASPMKGTIKRGINHEKDKQKFDELQKSEKDRAENVMILDLLRNDLGKISEMQSVNVRKMFEVEKYESLFQMTSTVQSLLKTTNLREIIPQIFPCGSITGAPKLRTMEIINELETEEREIYTGSIGIVSKDKCIFNVAIRTLTIDKKSNRGELGIGSGIVWDSEPGKEYKETLLKSNFLFKPKPYFEIFETLLLEDGEIFLLDYHLERMQKAADYFLFKFDRAKFDKIISEIREKFKIKTIIKLLLDKWGDFKYESREYSEYPGNVKVVISDKKIDSRNSFQYFKTTNRKFYNNEFKRTKEKGFFEVIFLNENDEVTEGAITNILIKKDGKYVTPPINSGILDGCYRRYILENWGKIEKKAISIDDLKLADEIYLVNSVRKLIKVDEVVFGTLI